MPLLDKNSQCCINNLAVLLRKILPNWPLECVSIIFQDLPCVSQWKLSLHKIKKLWAHHHLDEKIYGFCSFVLRFAFAMVDSQMHWHSLASCKVSSISSPESKRSPALLVDTSLMCTYAHYFAWATALAQIVFEHHLFVLQQRWLWTAGSSVFHGMNACFWRAWLSIRHVVDTTTLCSFIGRWTSLSLQNRPRCRPTIGRRINVKTTTSIQADDVSYRPADDSLTVLSNIVNARRRK